MPQYHYTTLRKVKLCVAMKNTGHQIGNMTFEPKFPGAQISIRSLYQQDNPLLSLIYPNCNSIIHQKKWRTVVKRNMTKETPTVESLLIVYKFVQILLQKYLWNPRWRDKNSFKFVCTVTTTQHDYFPILFLCIKEDWIIFISSYLNFPVFLRANNPTPFNKYCFSSNERESESHKGISTSLGNYCLPSSQHVASRDPYAS